MSECVEKLDEVSLHVDTSALEPLVQASPELLMGILVALVGVGVAVAGAQGKHRAWSIFTPALAALGYAIFHLQLRPLRWSGFSAPCVEALATHSIEFICRAFALLTGSLVQACVVIALLSFGAGRQRWAVVALIALGVSAITGGAVALSRRSRLAEFHHAVREAGPIPNVFTPKEPPRAHVGLQTTVTPLVESAGLRTGFIFKSRVILGGPEAKAWEVDTLTLAPAAVGLNTLTFHRARGPLSLDFTYPVIGVADEGPTWLPLAVGNRFEFIGTAPLGLDRTRKKYSQKNAQLPAPVASLEVTGTFERNGFRGFLVKIERGEDSTTIELTREDGALHHFGDAVVVASQDDCRVPFLWAKSRCTCAEDHVQFCMEIEQDGFGLFLRMALAVVSVGITEMTGAMKGVGEAHERRGLLGTRWVIDGVKHHLND